MNTECRRFVLHTRSINHQWHTIIGTNTFRLVIISRRRRLDPQKRSRSRCKYVVIKAATLNAPFPYHHLEAAAFLPLSDIKKILPLPMATLTPEVSLPTLARLGNPKIPETVDAVDIANTWIATFRDFIASGDVDKIGDVMVESSFESNIFRSPDNIAPTNPDDVPVYWRDLLALTWDIRTFEGTPKIRKFLSDRLGQAKISHVELTHEMAPRLLRPMPDLVWIQFGFKFETEIGLCSGIAKLVPIVDKSSPTLVWKAFSLFTQLDDLKGFPEKVGALRNKESNHGKWESARKEEAAFEGRDPAALIIGGGHSGLMVAARLKTLGVSALIIEKNAKIGDSWRTRYEALCLHDPVCELASPFYLSLPLSNDFIFRVRPYALHSVGPFINFG
jgi:hypothetical protein